MKICLKWQSAYIEHLVIGGELVVGDVRLTTARATGVKNAFHNGVVSLKYFSYECALWERDHGLIGAKSHGHIASSVRNRWCKINSLAWKRLLKKLDERLTWISMVNFSPFKSHRIIPSHRWGSQFGGKLQHATPLPHGSVLINSTHIEKVSIWKRKDWRFYAEIL